MNPFHRKWKSQMISVCHEYLQISRVENRTIRWICCYVMLTSSMALHVCIPLRPQVAQREERNTNWGRPGDNQGSFNRCRWGSVLGQDPRFQGPVHNLM